MSQAWEPSARSTSGGLPRGNPPEVGGGLLDLCVCGFLAGLGQGCLGPPALAWMKVGVKALSARTACPLPLFYRSAVV